MLREGFDIASFSGWNTVPQTNFFKKRICDQSKWGARASFYVVLDAPERIQHGQPSQHGIADRFVDPPCL